MKENKSNRETELCVIRVRTRGEKSKVTPLKVFILGTHNKGMQINE